MSLLHPTEEDDAFAAGHADAGLRKALRHIEATKEVLLACLPFLSQELRARAEAILRRSHYNEEDDGRWRLDSDRTGRALPRQP